MYMTVVFFLQQFGLGVEKSKFYQLNLRLADEGGKTSLGVTSSKRLLSRGNDSTSFHYKNLSLLPINSKFAQNSDWNANGRKLLSSVD